MGLISCYSELTVQLSQKLLCSNHKNDSNSVSPNLIPSIQTAVTNLYTTTLSTGIRHLITVTWCRNTTTQGLEINSGDDPTTGFRLNTNLRLFRKKKGRKSFEINDSKFEVFYDLSSSQYGTGAEPLERKQLNYFDPKVFTRFYDYSCYSYYVVIMVDSEMGLFLGDMLEAFFKKVKIDKQNVKFNLISRRECIYGNTLYSTKARFSDTGDCHDILIRCTGEGNGVVKSPCLLVSIDKRVVVRVKRLQWNFRGNQTIFVDGLSVDLMWDVHDWFFASGCGSRSGSGCGVFMFRTRNGLDSMLWLEDKKKVKDEKKEFTLLVYAIKS